MKLNIVNYFSFVGLAFLVMIIRYAIRKYTKMYKEYVKGSQVEDVNNKHTASNGGAAHLNSGVSDPGTNDDRPVNGKVPDSTNGVVHRKPAAT